MGLISLGFLRIRSLATFSALLLAGGVSAVGVTQEAMASSAFALLGDYGKDTAQMWAPGRHSTRSELFEAPGPARNDGFDLLRGSESRVLAIRCEEGWDGPRVWQYRDAILSEKSDDQSTRHLRYQFQNLDECFKARDALSSTREAGCRVRIDFIGGQPKGTARFRGVECDSQTASTSSGARAGASGSTPGSTPGSAPSRAPAPSTRPPRVSR